MGKKEFKQNGFLNFTKDIIIKYKMFVMITSVIVVTSIPVCMFNIFNKDIKTYRVTFESNGGTFIHGITIKENDIIYKPENPVKDNYEFDGWYYNDELYNFSSPVVSDIKLEAKWKKVNKVSSIKLDKTNLALKINDVAKLTATVMPEDSDNKNVVWETSNPNIVSVDTKGNIKALKEGTAIITVKTEDGGYTAKANIIVKKVLVVYIDDTDSLSSYTVEFKDEDGIILSSEQKVKHGNNATKPEDPVKEGYTFEGWYNGETKYTFSEEVKENITLIAKWVKNKYTITFKNYDGTVLETKQVEYGILPEYTGEKPTKAADNTYTYEFDKWDKEIVNVTGDETYTATFTQKYIEYVIKFVDEDGTSISEKTYHYGDTVEIPENPTKAGNAQYSYMFAGWSTNVTKVEKDATYTATYTSTINNYTVEFKDEDGTILSNAQKVEYGNKATKPEDPVKEGHKFEGWYIGETKYTFSEEVKENITLIAKWVKNKYTITFKNYDGTVLETKQVEYGTLPEYTGEKPTKAEDNTYTYEFDKWDKEIASVTEDTTYTATFTQKYIEYVIKFVDEDGTSISEKNYHYGDTVEVPENPTKEGNAQYTYTFAGWSPSITKVEKDATYTAKYTSTINSYTVEFKDEDGTILSNAQKVEYGNKATKLEDPVKEGHKFEGWYIGETKYSFNEEVKGNVTLTAKWTKNQYTITFKNYDGTVLETKQEEYGAIPEYTGKIPTKAADNTYTYEFDKWDKEIVNVTGDVTYTATFTSKYIEYAIKFVDEDGTSISEKNYHYGDTVEVPENPTKAGNEQYSYTFAGWSTNVTKVEKDATYTATYTSKINSYTITFKNYDGTVLETKQVEYGAIPEYTGKTPTKIADNTYTYEFNTWDKEIVNVTGDVTYTATFTSKYIEYVIKFVDEDGTSISEKNYQYGDTIEVPENPTKAGNAQYTYTFAGWSPSITKVEKDATYTATYTSTINSYTVEFKDEDGTILSNAQKVEYGNSAVKPENPTKKGYIFAGWYNGENKYTFSEEVKENISLIAKWTKNAYTVTFKNHDGTVLETKQVEYGAIPEYTGEKPTKAADNIYTYEFDKWDKEIVKVTRDTTYIATFTQKYNEYVIKFVDEDGSLISEKNYHYRDTVEIPESPTKTADAQYTYTFAGWSPSVTKVEQHTTYTATYTSKINSYTVTFKNYDGTVLETKQVEYGKLPEYIGKTPTKVADNTYTYEFNKWDKEIVSVTGNVTYTATFTSKYIEYVIKFVDEDGTSIREKNYYYGDTVEIPENPRKAGNKQYTYTFAGWSPSVTKVEKDATYTATYTSTINSYTVEFKGEDGTALSNTQKVEYGNKAVKPEDPVKEGYTFEGWYNGDTEYTFSEEVKENITLIAKWTKNAYTITFKNYDGTVLETKQVEYGLLPTYTGKVPTKLADGKYTYVFTGWSPSIAEVKNDTTYTAEFKYLLDIQSEIDTVLSKISCNNFKIIKSNNTINVKFISYRGKNPPYSLIELFYDIINTFHMLSNNANYKSFEAYYKYNSSTKAETIDLKKYNLKDTSLSSWYGGGANDRVGEWIGYLVSGKMSTSAAFYADSNDLVGKTITITIKLKEGYVTKDGKDSEVYYLKFE